MGLFSGRKALASSTFLGIGANPPVDSTQLPPASAAAPPLVPGAPAAPSPQPSSSTAPAHPSAATAKGGKGASKSKRGGEGDGEEEGDEEDNEDEDGDDDSDEEEMRQGASSTVFRARSRERARIGAIMGHAAAARNPDFAAHIALNTNMGRRAACALLDRAPAGTTGSTVDKPTGLASRMEGFRGIAAPPNAPNASTEQVQDKIMSEAFAKHAVTPAKKA